MSTKTENIRFINRDLSWLDFNARVLEEAQDPAIPLLERVKFLAISVNNLDEFAMVRMPILYDLRNDTETMPCGHNGEQQYITARKRLGKQLCNIYTCWNEEIQPALAQSDIGFEIISPADWDENDLESLASYFRSSVEPTLTPLAVDPTRPFPLIANLAICLAVGVQSIEGGPVERALVVVPKISRLIALQGGHKRMALLEDVIEHFAVKLFPGHKIVSSALFRVTRDASIDFEDEGAGDFLHDLEEELRNRGRGHSTRVEALDRGCEDLIQWIGESLDMHSADITRVSGPLDLSLLFGVGSVLKRSDLEFPTFSPRRSRKLEGCPFAAIRAQEHLLHHPYDSFDPIVELVQKAANDPDVLAIKQTLYRVSGDSPLVHALVKAAHNGKQVTVLVELKARFDEEANIRWARRLEESGAHVVYGLVGLKVHAKLLMIIRRDEDGLRRYIHLGTGNYNDKTAKMYTDISFLTCNESIGRDVAALFNILTGYSQPPDWNYLEVAPTTMRNRFVEWIRFEAEQAEQGEPAHIVAKFNSLVDPAIVEELYAASQAGVKIELIVRGMCILRAGVPGLSENISLRSVIGRYLEHSRIFYFYHGGHPIHAIASADWMTRNLDRRIEHLVVIANPLITNQLDNILRTFLSDRQRSRLLGPDDRYTRLRSPGEESLDCQAFAATSPKNQAKKADEWWGHGGNDPLAPART